MNDKNPLLIDTGRGFSVFYNKRYLYSTTDPEGSAVRKAEKTTIQNDTLYIIPSVLLFYGTSEILAKLPEDSHIICFELSGELLLLTLEHIPDFIKQSDRISVIENTSPLSVLQKLEEIGVWNFRRVKQLNLTGGYSLNSTEYKLLINTLSAKIEGYWKNRMTLIHMAPLWIKNIFQNLNRLYRSDETSRVSSFPKFNIPVVVAGAGESLEDSIEFIKAHRTKFKLMAVDTALSVLLENDILPDFIVAVDAQIYNLFDFLKLKNKKIPLFFDLTGYPGIPPVLRGIIYPFVSNFAETPLIRRLSEYKLLPKIVPPLGSVGLTAVYLALDISSSAVLYTGLDFSYKIGKSHAKGSPVHISELSDNFRLHPAGQPDLYYQRPLITQNDKKGNPVITDLVLNSYAELMRNKFKNNSRLFDIGSTGLPGGGKPVDIKKHFPFPELAENSVLPVYSEINKDNSKNFTGFCKNEMVLINKIYDESYSFLSGKTENSNTLLELLREADYLYLHFPDKSPYPKTDSGFLKRVLVSCGHYISILKTITSHS